MPTNMCNVLNTKNMLSANETYYSYFINNRMVNILYIFISAMANCVQSHKIILLNDRNIHYMVLLSNIVD